MSTFIEQIFLDIKDKDIRAYPHPHPFNVNGIVCWHDPRSPLYYFWYGSDLTGLVYDEFSPGMANISPYYHGVILSEVTLYRWTDLHKARTEEAFIDSVYAKALDIHNSLKIHEFGSFEDYIMRLKVFMAWLAYYHRKYEL